MIEDPSKHFGFLDRTRRFKSPKKGIFKYLIHPEEMLDPEIENIEPLKNVRQSVQVTRPFPETKKYKEEVNLYNFLRFRFKHCKIKWKN